jgi:proteasome lid subunit RPN8/RPN11
MEITMSISDEICYIMAGRTIGSMIVARFLDGRFDGSPLSVEFSWKLAMEREERSGDVAGFFHTHPKGFSGVSATDIRTMKGWVFCFGRPLLCVIKSGEVIRAYLFQEDSYREVDIIRIYRSAGRKESDACLRIVITTSGSTAAKS